LEFRTLACQEAPVCPKISITFRDEVARLEFRL